VLRRLEFEASHSCPSNFEVNNTYSSSVTAPIRFQVVVINYISAFCIYGFRMILTVNSDYFLKQR
jgi:hypothetical protein